jgi:hypothetical protein
VASDLVLRRQHTHLSSIDMRWLVPSLAISSLALAACAGLTVLKSCSVHEVGALELLAGMVTLAIYGLLVLNIMLALKDFRRN